MTKKLNLFIILVFFINSIVFASNIKEDKLFEDIINKQLEIKNFQVDIVMEIRVFSEQQSTFAFTYYFEEPDKVYLETKDFVLIPNNVLKTLRTDFLKLNKYNYKYLDNKDGIHLYEMIPQNNEEKYRLTLYLDLERAEIRKGEIFFYLGKYQEEFPAQIKFAKIGEYSLPVYIEGKLAIPTKFGMAGEVKELKEGVFISKLSNYYINIDFPEEIEVK